MIDELLAHPSMILTLAWLGSRAQIIAEVKMRVGSRFRFGKYVRLRVFQTLHSIAWTLLAYGLLVYMDMLDPITAVAAGIGADQVIDRITGAVSRGTRPDVAPGEAPSDVTVVADAMLNETTQLAPKG